MRSKKVVFFFPAFSSTDATAPLGILEMAREDAVHVAVLRNAADLAWHVVVHAGGELREVHEREERAQVSIGQRLRLLLLDAFVVQLGRVGERPIQDRRAGRRIPGRQGRICGGGMPCAQEYRDRERKHGGADRCEPHYTEGNERHRFESFASRPCVVRESRVCALRRERPKWLATAQRRPRS